MKSKVVSINPNTELVFARDLKIGDCVCSGNFYYRRVSLDCADPNLLKLHRTLNEEDTVLLVGADNRLICVHGFMEFKRAVFDYSVVGRVEGLDEVDE